MAAAVKRWTEITVKGPPDVKDEAIALLIKAGSSAVIESSRSAGRHMPETGRDQTLIASVAEKEGEEGASERLSALEESLRALGCTVTLASTEDRDWSAACRRGIKPVRIRCMGAGLLVRTSWSKALKRSGEAEVIIDPSMAFGTGAHPTTRMCLKALLMLLGPKGDDLVKDRILDIGTGSGVLLIAAMKLGASGALGLEIDPLALKVARDNLKINQVKARISSRPLEEVRGKFSLITANIFSEELRRLAPELVNRLGRAPHNDEGYVVLSGILREQAPAVISTYRGLGMSVYKKFVHGEWGCLVLRRHGRQRRLS
ncbi:MAG: 50S ribosomal protein L11 methyltransferase [Thermodesulfobacteriota bacterium]